jgi:DNA-binding CsgD family transcriptional regulator
MSPLEWGSREAWLGESLRRVLDVCGNPGTEVPADVCGQIEALLRLPNDEERWLHTALETTGDALRASPPVPTIPDAPGDSLCVVSMRCALAAGLAVLHQLRASRSALGRLFDDVETGMAIFENRGHREVARNARMEQLLREEPAREQLLELIEQAGRPDASTDDLREECRELELAGRVYRLMASRAPAGTLLPEAAVVILVDRMSPGLPTTQELRIAFGLRGREPQVALLAAEGLSNAAIAERLRLSAHTVRHYLERVLDRLGLHSRKALALHLMAGGERPQSANRRAP